ncbi:MAG: hydroxymethylbilane synthase [Candidatus Korarchaeum sp.]|nr:hydroxymethylbilane synthase [Candidatus Korarchaeum sp.]
MILNVGTRGSKLSLIQTDLVLKNLKKIFPDLKFNIKIIETTGDIELKKPIFSINQRGIFEKEIDQLLVHGELDFAVHSLKDVPIFEEQSEIVLAAVPKRDSPLEALVSIDKIPLKMLPKSAIIGTSSLRRMIQIKYLRPDLEVRPIRGNVDTRVQKVKHGEVHGVVLSLAGLERLGLEEFVTEVFPPEILTPPAGQGALAVVARKDRTDVIEILKTIDHPTTRAEVTAERSLISAIQGGCHFPIGAYACTKGDKLFLYGCILSIDGMNKVEASAEASIHEARDLGRRVASMLLSRGAEEIRATWREKYGIW